MKIRKYRESDAEELAEVHRKSIRDLASDDYSEEEIEVWSDVGPEDYELDEGQERFVAVEEGKIIGFAGYNMKEKEVTGLYMHPEWTENGVGKALLQKVEEEARKRGIEEMSCTSTITAREFYRKHGWEVVEESTHEIDGKELTVYEMEKEI